MMLDMMFFDTTCFNLLLVCTNSSLGEASWATGVKVVSQSLNVNVVDLGFGWQGETSGVCKMVIGSLGSVTKKVDTSMTVWFESRASGLENSSEMELCCWCSCAHFNLTAGLGGVSLDVLSTLSLVVCEETPDAMIGWNVSLSKGSIPF